MPERVFVTRDVAVEMVQFLTILLEASQKWDQVELDLNEQGFIEMPPTRALFDMISEVQRRES